MTAIDIRKELTDGTLVYGNFNHPPAGVRGEVRSITRDIDCTAQSLLAANTYDIFTVGDNLVPLEFIVSVTTAGAGAAETLDIGDEDTINLFEDDLDLNSTGVTRTMDARIEYTSEKKIRIQADTNQTDTIFSVTMKYMYV